jgi:uncharacterized protein
MSTKALLLAIVLATSVCVAGQDDSAGLSVITAAQEKIGREFATSDLSPFTAVASRYFSTGDAARVVSSAGSVGFAEASAPGGVADVVFDGRDIWVTPVAGAARLTLQAKRGEGTVDARAGRPLEGRTRIGDQEVVRVGTCYLEAGARPGSGRAIVYDPGAPLRKAFKGLRWFPPATAFQLKATYTPHERPDAITVTTSRGLEKEYFRVGSFTFAAGGRTWRLVALAVSATPKPGEELFIPFRDETTDHETYAVGRYLNVALKGPGSEYILDFNLATNPYCAYSPHYNCVIPPKENTLAVAIRAGEMSYAKGH